VRAAVAAAVAGELERTAVHGWPDDLTELPKDVERRSGEHVVRGYPAFVDEGATAAIRVFATAVEQRAAMRAGIRRLLRTTLPSPVKALERSLAPRSRLVLGTNPDGPLAALLDDCADAATDALVDEPAWSRDEWAALLARVGDRLLPATREALTGVERVLDEAHRVRLALPGAPPASQRDAVEDVRSQFRRLLPTGFVTATGVDRLDDLRRYLAAIGLRLDRLPREPDVDRARMLRVAAVEQAYADLVRALPPSRAAAPDVRDIGWSIEELRVSLWAQRLGTRRPVSEQRIFRAIDAVRA
jgi:ATP-dependent helicase HrpA